MASNQSPIQPNIQAPTGFHFVEAPAKVVNQRPPLVKEPQIQPNELVYYYDCMVHGRVYISKKTLRDIFSEPRFEWPDAMKFLQIETDLDGFYPAHFPTIVDLARMNPVAKCVMLWELENMPDDEDSPLFPPKWVKLIDPEPVLRDYGRVFLLRNYPTLIKNAEFSDAIDIFHVLAPMTHIHLMSFRRTVFDELKGTIVFNNTNIRPVLRKDRQPESFVPLHTRVVVWNTRGVNRRMFPRRFWAVVRTHQPAVLVLQETRSFEEQFDIVRNCLGGDDYNYTLLPTTGSVGGFIVMWKPEHFQAEMKIIKGNHTSLLSTYLQPVQSTARNLFGY